MTGFLQSGLVSRPRSRGMGDFWTDVQNGDWSAVAVDPFVWVLGGIVLFVLTRKTSRRVQAASSKRRKKALRALELDYNARRRRITG